MNSGPGHETTSDWSVPAYVHYVAQPVASGELQFTLMWDSITNLDLHVLDSGGTEINYGRKFSATGGELDVDDTNGFGIIQAVPRQTTR